MGFVVLFTFVWLVIYVAAHLCACVYVPRWLFIYGYVAVRSVYVVTYGYPRLVVDVRCCYWLLTLFPVDSLIYFVVVRLIPVD